MVADQNKLFSVFGFRIGRSPWVELGGGEGGRLPVVEDAVFLFANRGFKNSISKKLLQTRDRRDTTRRHTRRMLLFLLAALG